MRKNCKNCEYPWTLHHADTLQCPEYADSVTWRETKFQDYPIPPHPALSEGLTGWPEDGKWKAYRRNDPAFDMPPGSGFVVAEDGVTVIGRFPKFENAARFAAIPVVIEQSEAKDALLLKAYETISTLQAELRRLSPAAPLEGEG